LDLAAFTECFGTPRAGSAADLAALGLGDSEALRAFASAIGCGVFAEGLLSVASAREAVEELEGWEAHLPAGARLFATSAFGTLFLADDNQVWVVETQYGIVVEASYGVAEFFDVIVKPEIIRRRLRGQLFAEWIDRGGSLPTDSVLCPRPALALGGEWRCDNLAPVTLPVYLGFTAGLFTPGTESAVRIERLSDG
jgi:hypothetical protein